AEYDVRPDYWYFPCHFEGNPIMPGFLGLDGMWQLTCFLLDCLVVIKFLFPPRQDDGCERVVQVLKKMKHKQGNFIHSPGP
ncbi:hypothetical protein ACC717_37850, partial [Rhizobium ruizarguesonis]